MCAHVVSMSFKYSAAQIAPAPLAHELPHRSRHQPDVQWWLHAATSNAAHETAVYVVSSSNDAQSDQLAILYVTSLSPAAAAPAAAGAEGREARSAPQKAAAHRASGRKWRRSMVLTVALDLPANPLRQRAPVRIREFVHFPRCARA